MRKVLVGVGALLVAVVIFLLYAKSIYSSPGKSEAAINVVIPKGNVDTVLLKLQQEKLVSKNYIHTVIFRIVVKLTAKQGALHAAEFHFPKQVSIQQILSILRHAKPVQHELTIPEGLTSYQIANIVNNAPFMTGDIQIPAEGAVLPQTYAYEFGYSREKLLHRMQTAMQETVSDVWKNRQQIPQVKTSQDLVILASIVERETAVSRERPMIARVFINRLQKGMRLQSDPTVIYALTSGEGKLERPLTRQDWLVESPYNTYWISALPPTPICAPGKASLEAVAHPANGDMLFFVANGTGGHSFSNTLSQHNHNVSLRKAKK